MNVVGLFPIGVGISNIPNLPIEEHQELYGLPYYTKQTYGMTITEDYYVLDNHAPIIRKFIEEEIQKYSEIVLGTRQKLKITQSWCTKHDNIEQYTFNHYHQNSIISGAYYVSADQTNQGITFFKENEYNQRFVTWKRDPQLAEANPQWNSEAAGVAVVSGMLVLFPSQLKHGVEGMGKFSKTSRCSLAFNTWFDGSFGSEEDFTFIPQR